MSSKKEKRETMGSNAPKTQSIGPKQFPWKLHEMLETAEKRGEDNIVSWMPDGRSFRVHDRDLFVNGMMKMFFNQTKYKSFQRQLNLWGFERINNRDPNEKGAYHHPLFIKGRRDLCPCMTRQKTTQLPGPADTETSRQPGPYTPISNDLSSLASQNQSLNLQSLLMGRNTANPDILSMISSAPAAAPIPTIAPNPTKGLLELQQLLRNQFTERLPISGSQNGNDQLAMLLQRGLELQALRSDLHLAALLAKKREQEAELAAFLALAANRGAV